MYWRYPKLFKSSGVIETVLENYQKKIEATKIVLESYDIVLK
jgi:hypothetical protein